MVQIKMPDVGSVHNIVDTGSSDPGAYSLGFGKVFTGRAAGLVLFYGAQQYAPLVLLSSIN